MTFCYFNFSQILMTLFSFLQSVVVSGAKTSEDAAFPPDAVKSFHEKPLPTHDKGASHKPKVIQQPRK